MGWGNRGLICLMKGNSKDFEGKFMTHYKVHLCYELMVGKPGKSSSLISMVFLWVPAVSQHPSRA